MYIFYPTLPYLHSLTHNWLRWTKHCLQMPIRFLHKTTRLCWGLSPNITGTFGSGYANYLACTGIFSKVSKHQQGGQTVYSDSSVWKISADVQRQNPLFNDTNTVQPAALQTLIIIKIWIDGDWTVLELPYIPFDQEAEKSKFQLTLASSYRAVLWFFCLAWNAPLLDGKQHSLSAFRAPVMLGHTETQHHGWGIYWQGR